MPVIIVCLFILLAGGGVAAFIFKQELIEAFGPEVADSNGAQQDTSVASNNPVDPKTDPQQKKDGPAHKNGDAPPKVIDKGPPVEKDPPKEPEPKEPTKPAEFTKPLVFEGHKQGVISLALARNGKAFLSASPDKKVMLFSSPDGESSVLHRHNSEGVGVALGDDDRLAVFCDGGEVVVYDMVLKKARYTFFNPSGGVESMVVSPDGKFILLGANDGNVRKWDVAANKLERTFEIDEKARVTTVAIDSKGEIAAFGLTSGRVYTWDLVKSREIKRWKAHKGAVTALALAPDGDRVVSCGDDDRALVWNTQSGDNLQKFTEHKGGIYAVKWCADGKNVITGGMDKKLFQWSAETGEKTDWAPVAQEKILSLAVDSRDRFVLVGEGSGVVQLLPLTKPPE